MEMKAFERELLKEVEKRLGGYGFIVQKIEADQEQGEGLRCFFQLPRTTEQGETETEAAGEAAAAPGMEAPGSGGPEEEILALELDFIELDRYPAFQYYFYIREELSEERKDALRPALEVCNAVTPLGQMGFYENDLYYRYTQIFTGEEEVEEAADRCEDVLALLIVSLQINLEDISEFIGEKI